MKAYVFPGQGSQYVGMGKALAEKYPVARKTFDEADEALGFKLSELIFNGPLEKLTETANNQPALLTTSTAYWRVLEELKGDALAPGVVGGHSLGEYSALVAANAVDFTAAVKLVRKRGQYMTEAVPLGKGTMSAIIGIEAAQLDELCRQASQGPDDVVEAALYNAPGQIVVAGHVGAVGRLGTAAEAAGGKVAPLTVSGPFHSSPLKPAGDRLAEDLKSISFRAPKIPYVPNVAAEVTSDATNIAKHLAEQVYKPVKWEPSMRAMLAKGMTELVEVGPGRVLVGLMKKVDRKFAAISVDDEKGWAQLTS